jgi:hypothetical protein
MSNDLPPPNTQRWAVRRKAAVITAVRSGRITQEEALRRHNLTEEEYRSWERAFEQYGLPGLRSTRLQQYRTPGRRAARARAADHGFAALTADHPDLTKSTGIFAIVAAGASGCHSGLAGGLEDRRHDADIRAVSSAAAIPRRSPKVVREWAGAGGRRDCAGGTGIGGPMLPLLISGGLF